MATALRSIEGEARHPAQDGRIARGQRTREAILLAYEVLIADRPAPPTGAELAAEAGVSARSVFTHFGDMDGVLAAATGRAFDWVVATHDDIPPELPLGERLDRYVIRQTQVLERTAPLYRMFRAGRHGAGRDKCSPTVREIHGGSDAIRRRYLTFLFRWELDLFPAARESELVEALVMASSWNAWESLRVEQELGCEQARAVMRQVLERLLQS